MLSFSVFLWGGLFELCEGDSFGFEWFTCCVLGCCGLVFQTESWGVVFAAFATDSNEGNVFFSGDFVDN